MQHKREEEKFAGNLEKNIFNFKQIFFAGEKNYPELEKQYIELYKNCQLLMEKIRTQLHVEITLNLSITNNKNKNEIKLIKKNECNAFWNKIENNLYKEIYINIYAESKDIIIDQFKTIKADGYFNKDLLSFTEIIYPGKVSIHFAGLNKTNETSLSKDVFNVMDNIKKSINNIVNIIQPTNQNTITHSPFLFQSARNLNLKFNPSAGLMDFNPSASLNLSKVSSNLGSMLSLPIIPQKRNQTLSSMPDSYFRLKITKPPLNYPTQKRFEPFTIVNDGSLLGKGTFGDVFRSVGVEKENGESLIFNKARTNKVFIVKKIKEIMAIDPVESTNKEAELTARSVYPKEGQLVPREVYVINNEQGLFLVQQFMPSMSLTDFMKMRQAVSPLTKAEADKITYNLIKAVLQQAHQRGIVHSDLKWDNIMIDPDTFEIALIDFGASYLNDKTKMSEEGTLLFMSPEQVHNDRTPSDAPKKITDDRSDIYTLGIIIPPLYGLVHERYLAMDAKEIGDKILANNDQIIHPNEENRKSFEEGQMFLSSTPLINNNDERLNMIKAMTKSDPEDRIKLEHAAQEMEKIMTAHNDERALQQEPTENDMQLKSICRLFGRAFGLSQYKLGTRSDVDKKDLPNHHYVEMYFETDAEMEAMKRVLTEIAKHNAHTGKTVLYEHKPLSILYVPSSILYNPSSQLLTSDQLIQVGIDCAHPAIERDIENNLHSFQNYPCQIDVARNDAEQVQNIQFSFDMRRQDQLKLACRFLIEPKFKDQLVLKQAGSNLILNAPSSSFATSTGGLIKDNCENMLANINIDLLKEEIIQKLKTHSNDLDMCTAPNNLLKALKGSISFMQLLEYLRRALLQTELPNQTITQCMLTCFKTLQTTQLDNINQCSQENIISSLSHLRPG